MVYKENATVELLMTVLGIGLIVATTIEAYTWDIERIDGYVKRFASYLGILPSVLITKKRCAWEK